MVLPLRSPLPRVLIAEDDAALRELLVDLLREEGYDVLQAETGRHVLALLLGSPLPLIALLDQRLPDLDGQAVLAALAGQESPIRQHACILVTASADFAQANQVTVGVLVVPVIRKPFELEEVLAQVAHAAGQLSSVLASLEPKEEGAPSSPESRAR